MSDKSRLCHICGKWIPEMDDIVIMAGNMGIAHLRCAWYTSKEGAKLVDW